MHRTSCMLNSCCYTFLISSQNGRSYLSVEHSAFSVFNRAEPCYGEVQTLKDVLALAVFRTANILIAQLVGFVSPSNLLNSSGLLEVRMNSSSSNCLRHLVLGNNGLPVHLTSGEGGRSRAPGEARRGFLCQQGARVWLEGIWLCHRGEAAPGDELRGCRYASWGFSSCAVLQGCSAPLPARITSKSLGFRELRHRAGTRGLLCAGSIEIDLLLQRPFLGGKKTTKSKRQCLGGEFYPINLIMKSSSDQNPFCIPSAGRAWQGLMDAVLLSFCFPLV